MSKSLPVESQVSTLTSVELWPGCLVQVDQAALASSAIAVKGCTYQDPTRFLEIFANEREIPEGVHPKATPDWDTLWGEFQPRVPGVSFSIGPSHFQPPYCWKDATPEDICRSFTYNANAFYRILLNLKDCGRVDNVTNWLDRACRLLTYLYKANGSFLLKHVNNNINMYLISKTIEFLLGRKIYKNECQELINTNAAFGISLEKFGNCSRLETIHKMALAVGCGVSFIEERICRKGADSGMTERVERDAFAYWNRRLAIDDRDKFLNLIENAGLSKGTCSLLVVVDDATETVADLCWIEDLLQMFPFLAISLLANTAQVSVNFSTHMIPRVLAAFPYLAQELGTRFRIVETYCPLISFQTNLLMPAARDLVNSSDVVFIKGANFFETLQIVEKETFFAFVVYGPVSRACTGLSDFDAVWAHVPRGRIGYQFSKNGRATRTLRETVDLI
jgi:hypothetical protein